MKKTYKMFLALVLSVLGAVSVNAEIISLQEVPFCSWNGWGADAQKTGDADCAWVVGESTGLPYGDTNVINYADLSNYTKLIVVVADVENAGSPRFLFNRDIDEGQWNADESQSHLIDNTKSGWSDKYFSKDGNTYTVDLKLLVKDKGFAHLHAIKGANWANVTVESMEVERQAKAPVGWTSVIQNGNFEGEEVTSFFVAEDAVNVPGVTEATISDGAGVDASRGLAISSMAGATENWATQLFVRANEVLPEGTKWRFSMDVRADAAATIQTGAHAEPRDWKAGGIIPEFNVDTDWTPITYEGTVDTEFQSIAFDLNVDRDNANTFYFDNFNFEVFKLGTVAEFSNDVILLDFGFDTNMPDLVKKGGKMRLMYPMDCATVKVNGSAVDLTSVEGFADGRFYIFLEEAVGENDEVEVSFTNPTDEAYRLIYASGAVSGQAVADFTGIATNNSEVEEYDDAYPYDYLTPVVMKADPEDGSFNLPNSIKEFKLTFDKEVDCAALKATLNGNALTVAPADGLASEVTLTRAGDNELATGEYTINVTKIYPKERISDEIFGDTTYVINVGKPVVDPTDVARELIPLEYFNNCAAGSVPEGFVVYFGEEERKAGGSYGSGSRMFDFAAGGDFTKGLYFRDKYTEYGALEGYALTLEAGKKYNVHFNSAAWKDNGVWMKFQLLDSNDEVKVEQVIKNAPNVNGSTAAVNGSTSTVIKFVPEVTGDYRLRWYPATDENGTEGGFNEVLLANAGVKYVPNTAGIEWIQMLTAALEDAKSALNANQDERYNGAEFDALAAAIAKYEAEMEAYTAPSAYQTATDVLTEATQALKDHRQLCDDYDTQIKKAIDVQRQNAQNKFAVTELYAQLAELNAKYHGSSEWRNVADTIADPTAEDWKLFYNYDVLKDNDSLTVAVAELKDIANVTSLLFTEGVSSVGSSNNGKGTGVAVLVDRIRLGVEGLKQLGVPAEDELIQLANNALTDDDEIVDALKQRMTLLIYERLQDPANEMFKAEIDTTTFEEIVPSYDLTVFAKNPNIYKQQNNMNFTEENVPGWVTPEGYNKPGLSVGWGQPCGVEGIAEDCMFQTWGSSYRVEQTVTDLPAGVYTIRISFGERMKDDEANFEDSYAYVNTSDVAEGEIGAMMDCPGIGQSFPFASDVNNTGCVVFPDVIVIDGQVTFGVNAGPSSHTFFNDVRILMSGAAAGVDYQQAYNDYVETGIEAPKATTVRGIELYDLNGRRITSARQGVVIVKKYMSDGTVRTEKVVKK